MKFSEAMLKGYEKVGGRQTAKGLFDYAPGGKIVACCALGAIRKGRPGLNIWEFDWQFKAAWGIDVPSANDEGMPWEHIYGMAVAAGL